VAREKERASGRELFIYLELGLCGGGDQPPVASEPLDLTSLFTDTWDLTNGVPAALADAASSHFHCAQTRSLRQCLRYYVRTSRDQNINTTIDFYQAPQQLAPSRSTPTAHTPKMDSYDQREVDGLSPAYTHPQSKISDTKVLKLFSSSFVDLF
jgi:hypothetical protein